MLLWSQILRSYLRSYLSMITTTFHQILPSIVLVVTSWVTTILVNHWSNTRVVVSQTITHHKVTIVFFFFYKNMFPKFSTSMTTYFQRGCNSSVENNSLVYKARNKDLCQWLSIKLLSSQTKDLCQWLFIKLLSSQHIMIAIVITTFHYMLF